jgi:hypothetical protein
MFSPLKPSFGLNFHPVARRQGCIAFDHLDLVFFIRNSTP